MDWRSGHLPLSMNYNKGDRVEVREMMVILNGRTHSFTIPKFPSSLRRPVSW